MAENDAASTRDDRRPGWPQVLLIVLAAMLITAAGTLWLVKYVLYPADFRPVTLDAREQQILSAKLERLDIPVDAALPPGETGSGGALQPLPYDETGASRQVRFSERELNALLAKNTDLARKVAIDLADDLISARILVPVDPDFPILGGKTIRVRAGVEFAFREGRPVVRLRGLSVMGVPLPNAWLGGLKDIDLVREFGNDPGFWKSFADGIHSLRVEQGQLTLELNE
ncbi:MAG TPA: arginine N-succinyltransferase [Sedimenticola sp.]|nr:arginine N-succinyltransferase [Sedimenticola sp.]